MSGDAMAGKRGVGAAIFCVGAAIFCALMVVPGGSAWAARSPGFKPVPGLRNVAPTALPSISLGTGKYPNLLVDAAGTAHIVYTQDGGSAAPDSLAFCSLQRGIKRCAAGGVAPNPQAPDPSQGGIFIGNFPAGNHDFDGPVPLAIGNQLYVVQRRFPDFFQTPIGTTSDSNVFEWSSSDGGMTLTGPATIGDNQMAGGAVAYGDPNAPSIGTISATETGGTFFQGTSPGVYPNPPEHAELGTGDQAYDGSLAPDITGPTIRPVAAFADLSGNVFVREWSGQGDINNASTWSETSFAGFSPQIVGGPAGVFVLYSNSRINGGRLSLRRIVGGQPSGAPVALGSSASPPAVSEDASGELSFAYTDRYGVEVRTSADGVHFSTAQFTASAPNGGSIAHLVTAATADGGGFVSFVRNPVGAEGVGQIVLAAFGTQTATGKPGLGPLPGGGIGSAAGDQLATSTCQSVKFGAVDAEISPRGAGCYSHDPSDRNMAVSLGTIDLNGLLIIPDQGTRIGIDPKLHKIQTAGNVKVVLRASGIPDITLYHGPLAYDVPDDGPGDPLFTPYFDGVSASAIVGFPIEGSIDVKIARGGVDIPISLGLPKYLGGVTGSATLHASSFAGLSISSLEFKIGDANLGALELKNVDVSYEADKDVWSGNGELLIPAGDPALDIKLAVDFQNGRWTHGFIDVGVGWPGIPLDDTDPAPQLFFSHAGLDLRFEPATALTGTVGFGIIPIPPAKPPAGERDYIFSLDGSLGVSFGNPITFTVGADGYLSSIHVSNAKLTYAIPDQVSLTGSADLDLGLVAFHGQILAVVDPVHKVYGGSISSKLTLEGSAIRDSLCDAVSNPPLVPCVIPPIPDFDISGFAVAVNNKGFGVYVGPPGLFGFFGTVSDEWGKFPSIHPFEDDTGAFKPVIPVAAAGRVRAHAAAATTFTVPRNAPTASLVIHGASGPPAVTLISPSGRPVTPAPIGTNPSATVQVAADANAGDAYVGILHPQPGRWTIVQSSGSRIAPAGAQYSIGEPAPKLNVNVTGNGRKRTLHYRATFPSNVTITFVERTGRLLHVIGNARNGSGAILFQPAAGPAGRRQLIARIIENGLPHRDQTVGSYVAPPLPRPGRAHGLRVHAGGRTFTFSYAPPANASHVLIKIVATDGRRLERTVSATTRAGSVAAIGHRDGVTITVVGIGPGGLHGPATTAKARQNK
jgi:hypothetical protein